MYLLAEGYDVEEVTNIIGISRRMINLWINAYNEDGLDGLLIKKYPGSIPKIDEEIRNELVLLVQTPPREVGLDFSSWNTKTLQIWLKIVYNIEVTKPRIFQILKEEGFSWKKGEHKYILANEKEQKKFIRRVRKIIKNLKPNQIVLFQDECSVKQHPSLTYMWMKKGTVNQIPTYGNHKKNEFLDQSTL